MKKIKFIFVVILLLFIMSGCSSSDNSKKFIDLYGTVIDINGEYLENASIKIIDNNLEEKTNAKGIFKFENLNESNYKLEVSKSGFYSKIIEINLNKTTDLGKIKLNSKLSNPQDIYGNATVKGYINLNNSHKKSVNGFALNRVNTKIENPVLGGHKFTKKNINNEIIIHFNKESEKDFIDNKKIKKYNFSDAIETSDGKLVRLKVPSHENLDKLMEYFRKKPNVDFVEHNYKIFAQAKPNDIYYENQWNLSMVNLEAAWDQKKFSNSIKVAVLDSGLIPNHIDLEPNILKGANFIGSEINENPADYNIVNNDISDENFASSHGTHVAGIIGAVTNNNNGIAGVSWGINILPVKVLDENLEGSYFDIAQGIYYAVDQGADIINLSLGGSNSTNYLENAIRYAFDRGVVLVAATGNNGGEVLYPAAYPETISVGAIGQDYRVEDYSNFGKEVDLVAPGTNIYSTSGYFDNGSFIQNYQNMTGTSMSAAHVSGAAALLLDSGVDPRDIKSRLTSNSVKIDTAKYEGSGLLDVYGSLINTNLSTVPVRVFAGDIIKNNIYVRSDIERLSNLNYHSNYEVLNAATDKLYIIAWRDVNGNNLVDCGDYFGISQKEYLSENEINEVDLDMFYVTKDVSVASLNLDRVKIIVE